MIALRPTKALACVAALGLIAGCATFGTNVSGDFSCGAPQGTCAPTQSIDDGALALIDASEQRATPPWPSRMSARHNTTITAARGQGVLHSAQRILRVVFLPRVDERGRLHEQRAVHAVVDNGVWLSAPIEMGLADADAVDSPRGDERQSAASALPPSSNAPIEAPQHLSRQSIRDEVDLILGRETSPDEEGDDALNAINLPAPFFGWQGSE